MNATSTYRPDIDGLRAIAVASVLLFHLDITVFSGGFIGVDVFFVISGFLITRLIVDEIKKTGSFSFSNFYLRRIRRLLPAFFTVLIASTVAAAVLFSPHDFENFGTSAFYSIFSVSNIYFWREAGYFDPGTKLNPMLHTWSLSVEEQFYLVWPLIVLFFASRYGIPSVWKVLIAIILSSLVLNFAFDQRSVVYFFPETTSQNMESIRAAMFYLGPFRNFELGLGALLVFFIHRKLKSNLLNEVIFLLGLALVIAPIFVFSEETTFPSYNALIPCVGTAMIIYANNPKYSGFLLRNKFAVSVGLISYSLYLVHWPMIVFYKYWKLDALNGYEQTVIALCSVFVAFLIYKFIEQRYRKPFVAKNASTTPNATFVKSILGVGMLCVATTAHVWATNGWVWRLSEDQQVIFQNYDNPRKFHKEKYGGALCKPFNFCSVNADQERNVFFIGDSHSQQYAYGFAKLFPDLKFTHIDNRCRFNSLDYCYAGRFQNSKFVQNKINEFELLKKSNDLVIIGQSWGNQGNYYNTKTQEYVLIKNVRKHVDFLVSEILKVEAYLGKGRILVMGQVNRFRTFGNPLSCLRPKLLKSDCQTSPMTYSNEFNEYFEAELEKHNIPFISPTSVMCSQSSKECENFDDKGLPLYSDAGHLSIWGSEYVVERIQEPLQIFFSKN